MESCVSGTGHGRKLTVTRKGLLILLVVTLGLGLATLVVLRSPVKAANAPVDWLVTTDLQTLKGLEIEMPPAVRASFSPDRSSGEWLLRREDLKRPVWPVGQSNLKGLLRLVQESAGRVEETRGGEVPAAVGETRLLFRGSDDIQRVISVLPDAIGGFVTVAISSDDPKRHVIARLDASVAGTLTPGGIDAWRKLAPLPREGADTTALTLALRRPAVRIVRSEAKWTVTDPVKHPADHEAMGVLFAQLSSLRAAKLVDDPPDAATLGVDDPTTPTIEVWSGVRRNPTDPDRGQIVERVRLGAPADVARTTRFVVVEASLEEGETRTELWGPVVMVVETDRLAAIDSKPGRYIAKRAVDLPTPDAIGFAIRPPGGTMGENPARVGAAVPNDSMVVVRAGEGFNVLAPPNPPSALASDEVDLAKGLITLLCETPARRVEVHAGVGDEALEIDPPAAIADVIVCQRPMLPVAAARIGLVQEGAGSVIAVRTTSMTRYYEVTGMDKLVAWLRSKTGPAVGGSAVGASGGGAQ